MKASLTSILCNALAAITITSCQSNSYQIKGTAEGLADGDTLYLTSDLESGIPSDTIYVKDGRFSFSGETDSVYLCMMYSASRNEINAPFFLEPGTISISLSDTPGSSRVGGTKCNEEWQQMNDSVMSIGKQINRIAEQIYGETVSEEEQQKGMERIEQLNVRFSKIVINAVEDNIGNEFGYFLLTYYPDDIIDNETRIRLIEKLPADMKTRPAIQELLQIIKASSRTEDGHHVTDFLQLDPDSMKNSIE